MAQTIWQLGRRTYLLTYLLSYLGCVVCLALCSFWASSFSHFALFLSRLRGGVRPWLRPRLIIIPFPAGSSFLTASALAYVAFSLSPPYQLAFHLPYEDLNSDAPISSASVAKQAVSPCPYLCACLYWVIDRFLHRRGCRLN